MKKKYEYIAMCLLKFNGELGCHEEESRDKFFLSIKHDDFRRNLLAELEQALNDPELSWVDILDDNLFFVFSSDDEKETRDFIREYFYDPAMAVEQEENTRKKIPSQIPSSQIPSHPPVEPSKIKPSKAVQRRLI